MRSVAGLCLLALLLTASILGSIGIDRARETRSMQAIEQINRADTALQRDVLLVRTGLLNDYDPLVAESNALRDGLATLRLGIRRERLDIALAHALEDAVAREQSLIEHFKSEQALVRNSLAYFPLLATQAIDGDDGRALVSPVQALSQAVLRQLLDSTADAAEATQARVTALAALSAPPGPQETARRQLVRHAQLLQRKLPEVDGLLRAIATIPIIPLTQTLRAEVAARNAALERRAQGFQISLIALSVLMLALVARFLINLRRSRLELEERAANDALLARVSTSFVACEPEHVGDALDAALADIGATTGLDRVALTGVDEQRTHCWTRAQEPPHTALAALVVEAASAFPQSQQTMFVRRAAQSSIAALRALAATGTRDWACVRLRRGETQIALLSFETRWRQGRPQGRRRAHWPRAGIASLAAIGHVIEEALEGRRLAAEREALQARLRQAQRLEAAGTLASGLAHNLNNIIGAVLGHAEMASETLPTSLSAFDHVCEIRRAGERAGELVDNMLNFGRRDRPRAPIALAALTAETVSLITASLPHDVVMTVTNEADDTFVNGRTVDLQQVMLNLVRNAVQAVGDAGTITIRLWSEDVASGRSFAIGTLPVGAYVGFSVADSGPGIDAAARARIFEPFFTTKPAGTGLGLATVADIVRDHRGALDVHSVLGRGSVFKVWLPAGAEACTGESARRGQGEAVLFVEPDREALLKREEILAALGYEPTGFATLAAASKALHRTPGRFDALLVDARSGEDCLEIAASLRARRADLRVAVIGAARAADTLRASGQLHGAVIEGETGARGIALALGKLLP